MRRRHRHDPLDEVGLQSRRGPGELTASTVPDDDEAGCAQAPRDGAEVFGESEAVLAVGSLVRTADPSLVDRRDLVARFGYGLDLIAPCPPEFREAVDEQHEREVVAVLAHVSEVELASAGLDEAVLPGAGKEQNGIIGWCGHAFFLYVVLRPFDASVPDSAFQEQTVGDVIASPSRGMADQSRQEQGRPED